MNSLDQGKDVIYPVAIRPCREEDLPRILAIEQACFPTPWSAETFQRELEHPWSHFWTARSDVDGVLGFIIFWHVADEMHLTNLAVKPGFRRRGIAFRLVERAMDYTRRAPIAVITLEVRRTNVAAQTLYAHFGFSIAGVRRGYYQDTQEDALLMLARPMEWKP